MRSRSSRDLREGAGARIKRLNQSGLADRDMDQTGRRIEKRGVGASGDLPLMRDGAGIAVDFDHGRVVACHVKTTRRQCKTPDEGAKFIDYFTNSLEANDVLAAERGVPVSSAVREHMLPNLDPVGKETFQFPAAIETERMKSWAGGVVPDASRNGEAALRHDCDAVRPRTRPEDRLRFQRQRVDPGKACGAPVGDEDHAFGGDDAGRFGKARQGRDVRAGVVIDHLDAVPSGVRDEDAPALRIERAVIERACR